MKLLIIEDEPELVEAILEYLPEDEYVSETALDYREAEEKIYLYDYDIILLDITLPYGNGLDLLKILKENNSNAGIIIISAKDSLDDKLKGLDLGADDYLTKPFHLSELNSRIKAVIRRRKFMGHQLISYNEISISPDKKEVLIAQHKLDLTKKEYALLLHFIINKERVLSKASIAEHLWGDQMDMADNYDFIYTHLNNLRKKIKLAGGRDYIQTLYGLGYKFIDR